MKKHIIALTAMALLFALITSLPASADAKHTLTVGNTGNSIKPAMVVLAQQMGYYKDEGLEVKIEQISNLNEGITAVQSGKLDILPLGVIPSAVFISKGADLVIFGGTIAEGSQAVTLPQNKDKYKDLKAFKGKKVAFVRPETGHMIMKYLIGKAGVDPRKDAEFISLDGFQSVIEAVSKGAADIGFVNSGFGIIAEKKGLAIAFNVGSLAPNAVCCRQTTSRKALNEKRDAFVKFQTANLRAYKLMKDDRKTTIKALMDYSGQPESYVDYCIYGGVMIQTMDPAKNRIKDFYEIMKYNGDVDPNTKYDIAKAVDTSVYRDALNEMMKRHPNDKTFKTLDKEFAKNNK